MDETKGKENWKENKLYFTFGKIFIIMILLAGTYSTLINPTSKDDFSGTDTIIAELSMHEGALSSLGEKIKDQSELVILTLTQNLSEDVIKKIKPTIDKKQNEINILLNSCSKETETLKSNINSLINKVINKFKIADSYRYFILTIIVIGGWFSLFLLFKGYERNKTREFERSNKENEKNASLIYRRENDFKKYGVIPGNKLENVQKNLNSIHEILADLMNIRNFDDITDKKNRTSLIEFIKRLFTKYFDPNSEESHHALEEKYIQNFFRIFDMMIDKIYHANNKNLEHLSDLDSTTSQRLYELAAKVNSDDQLRKAKTDS